MKSLIFESKNPSPEVQPPKRQPKLTWANIARKLFALWVVLATVVWSLGGLLFLPQRELVEKISPKIQGAGGGRDKEQSSIYINKNVG